MKKLLLGCIKSYKIAISPLLDSIFGKNKTCRFEPTCSEYAYQAIEKYGVFKGSALSLKRLFRCHPWVKGGYDPLK